MTNQWTHCCGTFCRNHVSFTASDLHGRAILLARRVYFSNGHYNHLPPLEKKNSHEISGNFSDNTTTIRTAVHQSTRSQNLRPTKIEMQPCMLFSFAVIPTACGGHGGFFFIIICCTTVISEN